MNKKKGEIQMMCHNMEGKVSAAKQMDSAKKIIPEMIEVIAQHHVKDSGGNTILLFLPGLSEIEDLDETLSTKFSLGGKDDASDPVKEARRNIEICLLHSLIDEEEQMKAFSPLTSGCTRVILSSNIAESSVTLPQTRYIIDVGLVRQVQFKTDLGITSMQTTYISHASANQRSGRCGRLFPGVTFRLYTERYFDNVMIPYDIPEMLRLSLSSTVLRLKNLSSQFSSDSPLSNPRQSLLQALQPPENSAIDRAVIDLIDNGALCIQSTAHVPHLKSTQIDQLSQMGGQQAINRVNSVNEKHPEVQLDVLSVAQVTDLGGFLNHLPFDLRVGRLVAMGARCGRFVCHALLVAATLTSIGSLYLIPYVRPNVSAAEHEKCANIAIASEKERHKDVDLLSDAFLGIRLFRKQYLSKRSVPRGIHNTRYTRFLKSVRSNASKLEELLPHHHQWLKVFRPKETLSAQEFNEILSFGPKDVDMMRLLMAMAFKKDGLIQVTVQQKQVPPPSRVLEAMDGIEKRIAIVQSVPQGFRSKKGMQKLLPTLTKLADVVHFPPLPSAQMCLVFPAGQSVDGLYVAPSSLCVWRTFMKKQAKLTLQAPSSNEMVALKELNVPYKSTWSYQGRPCQLDRYSALAHMVPDQGGSLSLCAIPGTVQWMGRGTARVEYLTVIPPSGFALTTLVLLLVHQATALDRKNLSAKLKFLKRKGKGKGLTFKQKSLKNRKSWEIHGAEVQGEVFTLPRPVSSEVLCIPEVCEFAALERDLLQTNVDSATLSGLDEHKLAILLDMIEARSLHPEDVETVNKKEAL